MEVGVLVLVLGQARGFPGFRFHVKAKCRQYFETLSSFPWCITIKNSIVRTTRQLKLVWPSLPSVNNQPDGRPKHSAVYIFIVSPCAWWLYQSSVDNNENIVLCPIFSYFATCYVSFMMKVLLSVKYCFIFRTSLSSKSSRKVFHPLFAKSFHRWFDVSVLFFFFLQQL